MQLVTRLPSPLSPPAAQTIAATWTELQLDMVEYKTTYKLRR